MVPFIVPPHWKTKPETSLTNFPTQSHYPNTELTSPCPILAIPSARLGVTRIRFLRHWFDLTGIQTPEFSQGNPARLMIQPTVVHEYMLFCSYYLHRCCKMYTILCPIIAIRLVYIFSDMRCRVDLESSTLLNSSAIITSMLME